MKKTAILLAGAVAFDLGVMIIAGQAAETPKGQTAAPAAPGLSQDVIFKFKTEYIYLKLDAVNTVRDCDSKHGKVVDAAGISMCRLPAKAAPGTDGR